MLLFSLLLVLASNFQCDATDIIGCESSTLDLYCTNGKAIRVLSANYGRTSIFPCYIYFGADNCKAANSTQIVSHRCNNQQKCSIDVSNSLFGDPCVLVPKYLEVNYTCDVIQEEDQVLVTCQDQTMVLVCPDGLTLEILEADYGRGCYDLCPSPGLRTDLNCSASNSTEILRENCDGFNTCILNVTDDVFGDPCSGVAKYLKVNYTCLAPTTPLVTTPTPKPTYPTICEDDELTINCAAGSLINITYAFYGRASSTICHNLLSLPFQNCSSPNATQTVSHLCDNLPSCTITASNNVFGGDPCFPGTRKYLEVDWTCNTESSTACQDADLTINCPNGTSINVGAAVFGRIEEDICPGGIVPLPQDQNCTSPNATDISIDSCDHLQSCTLNANSSVFGDPCPGTRKYLQVNYTCPFTSNTGPVKDGTVCQGQALYMSCPGQVINVINALFGRLNDSICKPLFPLGSKCQASGATNKVRQMCENKESCNVSASVFVFGDPCILISKYLQVNYTCVNAPPPPPPPNNVTIECEGSVAEIRCPARDVINIVYANYGRTSLLTCPSILGLTKNCISRNATQVVRNRCENLNSCTIGANNGVFGDPCNGIKKYLEIVYTCQPLDPSTVRACQNSTLTITCSIGTTIDVVSAKFGRTSNKYCSTSSTPVANCTTSNATSIVQERCDDQQYCAIQASNSLFGNPCGGTPNYLEVSYTCFVGTPIPSTSEEYSPVELNQTVCDNTTRSIYCPWGEINIVYANYGRTSPNTCTHSPEHVSNCQSSNATEIVRRSCENSKICTITANSSIYGDPCIGVSKYLEVIYFCEEISTSQQSVCENETLNLSCPSGEAIDIVHVEYGRSSNTICPIANYSSNEYCISNNASAIVIDLCDDKQNCSVIANNEVLGNVCPAISKYLQVIYKCLNSKISSSSTPGKITVSPTVFPNTSCENGTVHLSCPNGDTIEIIDVIYGRLNNQVCPTNSSVNNCSASDAKEITAKLCDHTQECSVGANNNVFGNPCPGVEKYLQITYTCLVTTPTTGTPTRSQTELTTGSTTGSPSGSTTESSTGSSTHPIENYVYLCENLYISLDCFNGEVINIVYANWGRTSANECIGNNSQITDCIQPNTTEIVRNSCENKKSCSLSASSEVYSDPCIDVSKYLEVVYFCTELKPDTSTVCENGTLNLSCPDDAKLDIVSAVYGRFNNDVCPVEGGNNVSNCSSENATTVIKDRCDDKQECSVVVSSELFGDPCSQVSKYLQVSYMCLYSVYTTPPTGPTTGTQSGPTTGTQSGPTTGTQSGPTTGTHTGSTTGSPSGSPTPTPGPVDIILNATSCQGSVLLLACPDDDFIFISEANYGSTDIAVCPLAHNSSNSTCTSNSTATSILSDNCDGLNSCVANISSELFENPCIGAYKSLVVSYICAKRDTNQTIASLNETACENTELNLSCANGEDLNIINANYGRSSSSVCPQIGHDQNTNCTLQNSTLIVSESCDGQSSCSINATNSIFGDACPGTYKYLEVEYSCPERLEVIPSKGTACQGRTLKLTCPVGQHLDILLAIYGRLSTTICPTNNLNENTNCTSFNVTSLLSSRCNNAETCSINATSSEFGDPCPNTNKYLEVYYRCSAILQCGLHEKIGCASSCTNRMCGISSNHSLCLSKICAQGCVCQNDYVRDPNNGLCIEEKYCPLPGRPCQTHEVFTRCGAGCQTSCVEPHPTCTNQCISGYVCKEGFIRDTSTGRCVRSEDCPCS